MISILFVLICFSQSQCYEIRVQGELPEGNKETRFITNILDELSQTSLGDDKSNLIFRVLKDPEIDQINDQKPPNQEVTREEEDILDWIYRVFLEPNTVKKVLTSSESSREYNLKILNPVEKENNILNKAKNSYGSYKSNVYDSPKTGTEYQTVNHDQSREDVNPPKTHEEQLFNITAGKLTAVYKVIQPNENQKLAINSNRPVSYPANSPGLPIFTVDHLQGDPEAKQCFLLKIQYYYDSELEKMDYQHYEDYGKPYPDHLIAQNITKLAKKCSVSIISYGNEIYNEYWSNQYKISDRYSHGSHEIESEIPQITLEDLAGEPYDVAHFLEIVKFFKTLMLNRIQIYYEKYGAHYPNRLFAYELHRLAKENKVTILSYGGKPFLTYWGNHTFQKGKDIDIPEITFDNLVGQVKDKKLFLEYLERHYKTKLICFNRDYFEKFAVNYPHFLVVNRLRGLAKSYNLKLRGLGDERFD